MNRYHIERNSYRIHRSPSRRSPNQRLTHERLFAAGLYGRRPNRASVFQMSSGSITGSKTIAVNNVQQSRTNLCWAAVGYCIHKYYGGTSTSESTFVTAKGSATARSNYTGNRVTDIDAIIGSGSSDNHLSSSDSSAPFSKSVISRELNANRPIIANVNNNHYVVICGKRFNDGSYQVQIMDPASGTKSWVDTSNSSTTDNGKINTAGTHTLSVLYYTKT